MKKLLLLATLLVSAIVASAETRDLGHVTVGQNSAWPYDGYTAAADEPAVGFGIKLTQQMVGNYSGCKIIGFRVGWGSPLVPGQLNMFIREGSFNAPDAASQQATVVCNGTTQRDWNEILLDNPYEIPAIAPELYIGFTVDLAARTPSVSFSTLGNKPENSAYISWPDEVDENGDRIWYDCVKDYAPWLIVAIVEIPDGGVVKANHAAQITSLLTPGVQRTGEMKTAFAAISNQGTEDITSFKLRYSIGDKSSEYFQELKTVDQNGNPVITPIPAGEQKFVYIPVAALATGETKIEITEVNNEANTFKQDLSYPMLAVPADVAENYVHRPVVEFFGSEATHLHPYYFDSLFSVGWQPYADRISRICHHVHDQFMTGDDDDDKLAMMLCDNLPNVGLPAIMYDRSVIPTDPQRPSAASVITNVLYPRFAHYPYEETLARPTFASVNVATALNQAKDELQITVSGNIADGVLPAGEELCISVYLLEDNVLSEAQDWGDDAQKAEYGGVMKHQAVIRQRPTEVFGDVLAAAGDYSKTYTVDIDPTEWKLADMRVVALLHRTSANKRFERQVINCGEVFVDPASIVAVAADGTEATISVANGQITVNGSAEGVNVYSLSGASLPNAGLLPGIYVVSTDTIKTKVIVK